MISKRHIRFALVNSLLSCDCFVLQATWLFIIIVLILLLLSRGLKITSDIDDVFWYFKTVLYGICVMSSALMVFFNFLFLNLFLLKIFAFDILMLFYLVFNAWFLRPCLKLRLFISFVYYIAMIRIRQKFLLSFIR